ncbi:MAG: efflux RND transporter permease subunit [Pseudomonadota bacterium]
MKMMRVLLTNDPLVNILFAVVLIMGLASYLTMPREQDPEINFNFVSISTVLPGTSAADVEQLATGPLEDALRNVKDIRYVESKSRENVSEILVRFRELSEREFDKRVTDLRREIQSKANDELPEDAEDPRVIEITSSNGFPTATVLLIGQAYDEDLRRQAKTVQDELERVRGVDQVQAFGFNEPELHVVIDPAALVIHGLTAADVADQLRSAYRDVSAGEVGVGNEAWLLRVAGKTADPDALAGFLVSPRGAPNLKIPLDRIASVRRAHEEESQLVSSAGSPAISMAVTKVAFSNTLELVERINAYIAEKNRWLEASGLRLVLADDQTVMTRKAIGVMQNNAALGLTLVLMVCWLFLGVRIAAFVTMGIAFSIAGAFWALSVLGSTVNVSVLLGIVIVLGMLVDDAVVVVEALYYRLQRGQEAVSAALDALLEVGRPVLSAVLTTISAFLPLMLLPGIVGEFMRVVPIVVALGLLVSLVEAFWILPAHVISVSQKRAVSATEHLKSWRGRWTHLLRIRYTKALAFVFRRPLPFFAIGALLFVLSIVALATNRVKVDFFASDPFRIVYINIDMPTDAPLEETLAQVNRIQAAVEPLIEEGELRAMLGTAGLRFTDVEALFGDNYGQVQLSLNPERDGSRKVTEVRDAVRAAVEQAAGNATISYFIPSGGPPTERDISIKMVGDDYDELRTAISRLKDIVATIPGADNIEDDDVPGRQELTLELDNRAIRDAGLAPGDVARLLRLHVDGEVVAFTRDRGEKVELRVRGPERNVREVDVILDDPIALPNSGSTTFRALTVSRIQQTSGTIKHYNYRRSITVLADLGDGSPDTITANRQIVDTWLTGQQDYPGVALELSGAFDDIEESLDSMLILFLFGLALIYLILATQFKSYFQPLLILFTVPMAFTGVVFGLFITQYALSLYTLYGIVALTGIAVNAAIVLIDATNSRIADGMRPLHAVMYAARRRVVPILMTSLTTIAGLFSLATGLGGKSALWGPVAASMVFGLMVGTVLTLFLIPVLARAFMRLRDPAIRRSLLPRFLVRETV